MTLKVPEVEVVPLKTDPDGTVRVKGTRVTLDLVIQAYNDKVTAEEIVDRYDTLDLGDIYAVISYYLHHKVEVDAYMQQRNERAEQIRRENEARFNPIGVKERLLARRKNKN